MMVVKYDVNGDLDTTWGDGDAGKIVVDGLIDSDYGLCSHLRRFE